MKIRKLTEADVTFTVRAEPEHEHPKDYFASGDDEIDKLDVINTLDDLNRGNEWAWCTAVVTATWESKSGTFTGTAALGCCNYASEEQFRSDAATMASMEAQALSDLNRTVAKMADALRELEVPDPGDSRYDE